MADLGKAYVQIIPSAEGIADKIRKVVDPGTKQAGEEAGDGFAKRFAGAAKKIIAAAGIGKFIGDALNEGGKLEQSYIGGLDTLYGSAAESAREYAREAAKAGISANDYAEQAVSFGAALKNAFSGDVTKAAEAANTAIMDMADNSAKMGTDIGSVQAAYQGFAKQNYTMLDNLKLGYGGTKSEMERLLARANELNAQQGKMTNYSIDNLGDVYDAIHVVQDDLGLTGVAAQEAASTLSGSFNAVKASFQNLIGQMALGEDIAEPLQTLTQSAANWLFGNLLPMIGRVLSQIPTLIVGAIQGISAHADELIFTGVDMVADFITGIVTAIPKLVEAAGTLVRSVISTITSIDWMGIGSELLTSIDEGILIQIPELLNSAASLVDSMSGYFMEHMPDFLNKGIEIVGSLITGLWEKEPEIIESLGNLVSSLISLLLQNLPLFMEKGSEFILNMVSGIIANLPNIIGTVASVVASIVGEIASKLPEFLSKGFEIIGELISGLLKSIPDLIGAIPKIVDAAKEEFMRFDWLGLGSDIVDGIISGIRSVGGQIGETLKSLAKGAWEGLKDFFGIASPSKLMRDSIGRYIPEGLAIGIEANADSVYDAMDSMSRMTVEAYDPDFSSTSSPSGMSTAIIDELRSLKAAITGMQIVLDTGATVGGLAPAMDTQLGAFSTYKGRGN